MLNLIADVLLIATGQGPTQRTERTESKENWNDRFLPRQMQDEAPSSYRWFTSPRGQN